MNKETKYRIVIDTADGFIDWEVAIEVPFFPILPIGSSFYFDDETRFKLEKVIYDQYRIDYYSHVVCGLDRGDLTIDEYRSKIKPPVLLNDENDNSDLNVDESKIGYIDTSNITVIKDYAWEHGANIIFVVIGS